MSSAEYIELKAQLDRIEQLLSGVVVQPAPRSTGTKTPAQIALEMARSGDIEGSKAYLKSLSGRGRRKTA